MSNSTMGVLDVCMRDAQVMVEINFDDYLDAKRCLINGTCDFIALGHFMVIARNDVITMQWTPNEEVKDATQEG